MVFKFNPDQIRQIKDWKAAGSYPQAYRQIADWAEDGNGVSSSSILWLRGAADINENTGFFSSFIRSYSNEQSLIRKGVPLDQNAIQNASNAIADKVLQEIIDRNQIPDEVDIPPIDVIARDDAQVAASVLFDGELAMWAGNPLFLALGYDGTFLQNLLSEQGNTYDLLASIHASYSTLGSLDQWYAEIPEILKTISGADQGFVGTGAVITSAVAQANSFIVDAYGGTFSILDAHMDNIVLGTTIAGDELSGTSGADFVHGEAGADTITASGGNDVLDGGSGEDTVDYSSTSTGLDVTIKEEPTSNADYTAFVSGSSFDTLFGIERIIGSAQNDSFVIRDAVEHLVGLDGSDGNEDQLSAFYLSEGVTFDVVDATAGQLNVGLITYEIANFEVFEGTNFDDTFIVDVATAARLIGREGDADLADFSQSSSPLVIAFDTGSLVVSGTTGGATKVETIERLIATSEADTLTITGEIAEDTNLLINAGVDQGPDVRDVIDLSAASEAMDVNIDANGTGLIGAKDGSGGAIQLENFQTDILGSDFDDALVDMTISEKLIDGGAGNDEIALSGYGSVDGGLGDDVILAVSPVYIDKNTRLIIDGGAGNDTIYSFGGDGPVVYGGVGDDRIFVQSFGAEVYGDGAAGSSGQRGADTFIWAPDVLIADAEAQDRLEFYGKVLTGGIANGGEELQWANQSSLPFLRYGLNPDGELVVNFAGKEMYVADYQGGPNTSEDDLGINIARLEYDFRNLFDPRSPLKATPLGEIIENILKSAGVLLPEDPLALDLDGDGLEFSGLATSDAYFDLDGDGFAERTGWLRSDDGFLALDRDGDGAIGGIGELFGAPGVSGFAELSDLDSNGDGVIDALDAQFSELRVWRDLNQDGVSSAEELFTLGELDIVSIDLNSTVINVTTSSDHILHAESTFTRGDGTQGSVYDVLLDASQFDTRYLGDAGTADWAANVPDLKGYGLLTDLKVAASNDLAVAQALAQVSANLNVVDLQALVAASEPLLLAWNDANTGSAELTAVLVQSDAGGAQWLDYGVYHEDAQGGYWSLASGNPVLDGGGVAIARPSLEDLLAQTPGANQAWRLEQMWSPERNATLNDRPAAPYKVALDANGKVTVLDHGIYNEDAQGGYWTLASGTAVLDSMGAAIARPSLQDVLAQTAAEGTAWRVESFAEPDAAALVESFAIFYLNGNAVDYSVYVDDPMGGYWASAQAVADAVALGQPAPAGATHADLASFVSLYLAQQGASITSHELVDADKARYALKTGGAALSDLDNLVATVDPVEGLVYAQNVAQQSGFLEDVLERYEFWGEAVAVRLASQTGLVSFFQGVVYDAEADVFEATTSRELIPLYEATFAAAPGDAQTARAYLQDWREILSVVYADFKRNGRGAMSESLVFANVVAAYESTGIAMGVIEAAEELGVSSQNIFHDNTDGATVEGTSGQDIFYLSSGNQTFRGGRGSDVYVVGKNFGQDVIDDVEPEFGADDPDLVRFADIQSTEVSARREGIDLILTVDATGDELRIAQQFEGRKVVPISGDVSFKTGVTEIAFADGVVWDRVDMAWAVADPQPTSDLIEGTREFDVMDGGAGNDTLRGGVESDLYLFKLGYGQDLIEEEDGEVFTDHTDMVMFGEGITKEDLVFQRNGQSTTLEILVGTAGDSLTISQQFSSAYPGVFEQQWFHRIELFTFDDGSYYNWDDIIVKMVADAKTDGDDTIYGFDYDDRLDGGAGNDSLNGGNDSDTYIFGRGYGQDIVYDQVTRVLSGNNDRVIFQDGITQADVVISRAGEDLIFDLIGTTDRLTIKNNFGANNLGGRIHAIEEFQFADGSSWNTFDVQQILLQSTDGDDSLLGFFSDDTLDGGLGNDTLVGGNGADTYVFGVGYGSDVIDDEATSIFALGPDILQLGAGITADDITLSRAGHKLGDLVLTLTATGDQLTILDQFAANNLGSRLDEVEEIHFADGSSWNTFDVQQILLQSTDGDDSLLGFFSDDTLDGGLGNDTLIGGNGADTYVFGAGYGSDVIDDQTTSIFAKGPDILQLGAGITTADIALSRTGHKLGDLILTLTATGDQLTVLGQFATNNLGSRLDEVEEIHFADGTVWDRSDLQDQLINQGATSGDDTLVGFFGVDILDGGAGNDRLLGGNGGDIYVFGTGYGSDVIFDNATSIFAQEGDQVTFTDEIAPADLILTRQGDDLIVNLVGSSDRLRIEDQFLWDNLGNRHFEIESFAFADGTVWNAYDIQLITLEGTAGDDVIYGFYGADTLDGGAGNDTLVGDDGSDTYLFDVGYGRDEIRDLVTSIFAGESDRVVFGPGIAPADLSLERQGNDLLINVTGTDDSLRIFNQFWHRFSRVENFEFDDGTVWSYFDLTVMLTQATAGDDSIVAFDTTNTIDGLAGNDTINGGGGNDTITGGLGDDSLSGGNHDDTYFYTRGDGHDVIVEEQQFLGTYGGTADLLVLQGVAPSDVSLVRNGSDATLIIAESAPGAGDGGSILLKYSIDEWYHRGIDQISFDDGTLWTRADLRAMWLAEALTAGDDSIDGFTFSEAIDSGAGNDTVRSARGNDTLTGGEGNDSLMGGLHNDTYIYARGDGHDVIVEEENRYSSDPGGTLDRLVLHGIAPSEISLQRNGNDAILVIPESAPGAGDNGSIVLKSNFDEWFHRGIDEIAFDDGTIWVRGDLRLMWLTQASTAGDDVIDGFNTSNEINGLAGNDTLNGGWGNDTLAGGSGNDSLVGGHNDDVYIYSRGDGHDVIVEEATLYSSDPHGSADRLVLQGIPPAEVSVLRNGSDATLVIPESAPGAGDGGSLLLKYSMDEWKHRGIDEIVFDDGTIWTRADLRAAVALGGATVGDDVINGFNIPDVINGLAGNDTINGGDGNDTISGNLGNDSLVGGYHNDTYIYARGDGHDVIVEGQHAHRRPGGTADRLVLQGIAPSEITLQRSGNHATLVIAESAPGAGDGGSIVLRDNFDEWENRGVEEIAFDDGTTWARVDLRLMWLAQTPTAGDDVIDGFNTSNQMTGLAGNDTINGFAGNDIITGGLGDDSLTGGDHNDTYIYARGDGHDVIVEGQHATRRPGGTADRLVLQGIAPSEITLQRSGNHATLVIAESSPDAGDAGSIVLRDNFDEWEHRGVDEITFDDGTTWARVDLRLMWLAQAPTDGDDVIDGFNTNNEIVGLAGDDTINAGSGNDVITGGLGNDSLSGGWGNDTYIYARGDGHDIIVEGQHVHRRPGGTADRLVLQGIAPSEITLQRSGNHITLVIAESVPGAGDGGSILLRDNLDEWESRGIEEIAFDDGTTWARVDLRLMWLAQVATAGDDVIDGFNTSNEMTGLAGNDTINGFSGNDVLIGGLGNDSLSGGTGNDSLTGGAGDDSLVGGYQDDTYIYARGDGHDVIVEGRHAYHWLGGTADRLVLQGIAPSEITLQRSGNHATLVIAESSLGAGDGGSIVLRDNFEEWENRGVEEIAFDDGTTWARVDLRLLWLAQTPTAGDDVIDGFNRSNTMWGLAGDDTINGFAGNDTLIGGAGADVLNGGDGTDTASYAGASAAVFVDLVAGTGSGDGVQSNWGVTDLLIDPSGPATTLEIGVVETSNYGNNFAGTGDGDGVVEATFTGTGQDLTLRFDAYDLDYSDELEVLLNGTSLGFLAANGDNLLSSYQFQISAAQQQAGENTISFMQRGEPSWNWGVTNILLDEAQAGTAIALTPRLTEKGAYGNGFRGSSDGDGRVDARFAGLGEDVLLTFGGFDIDYADELEVLLNGSSLGFLAPSGDNVLASYQFEISAAQQQSGDNVISFMQRGGTNWIWGVTDILIEPTGPVMTLDVGVMNTGSYGNNFTGTGDSDGAVGASFMSTGQDLVLRFDAFDNDTPNEIEVLLNGSSLGFLGMGVDGGLSSHEFSISSAQQQAGENIISFMQRGATAATWGVTNILLAQDQPGQATPLLPSHLHTEEYGNNFNGITDADGRVDVTFTGTGEDQLFTFSGYDIDFGDEVEVLLNGASLGFLAAGTNDGLSSYQFQISAAQQQVGENIISFVQRGIADGDSLISIENLIGSDHGDRLAGNAGVNRLEGGAGDDTLVGGAGGDQLLGDTGVDTASYAGSSAGVSVDLATGSASGGHAAGDSLTLIENLVGSDHGDSLTGDSGANLLEGGLGNDSLSGGAGDDRYAYALGDGDDAIDNAETAPATADDRLLFGQGLDTDDLWFTQDGDDLLIQILDDQRGSLRVQDWYAPGAAGDAAKLDAFETSAGAVLVEQNVQQLVDAMAGLPAGGGDVVDSYKDQVPASVSTAITAAWQ